MVSQHRLSNLESIISTRFTGFPAADQDVREFLNNGSSPLEVNTRYAAFFTALFQQLLVNFQEMTTQETPGSFAHRFRFHMTYNQTYGEPNEYRKTFYKLVCSKAEDVSNGIYTLI
jgi:hypothetical protein